jgi:hypothetical protein
MTSAPPADTARVTEHPSPLWPGVDALIDRAASLPDLEAHRLHLLAARHWRTLGRRIPERLVDAEIRSAVMFATAKAVLERARAACDGPLLVLKGPHTATFYPSPQLRPFVDVDLLAGDPERAHASLRGHGFVAVGFEDGYYDGLHHLRPLADPSGRLTVEIHRHPNWFAWSEPPARDELIADARADVLGVSGIGGLSPVHHALVLAAHSWVELPFRRVSDLVDVAAVAATADRDELGRTARRWGMERVWQTTIEAADALLCGGPVPAALRICASNFLAVRDRTVQETHLRRLLSGFWARPPLQATASVAAATVDMLLPAPSDTWSTKLARSRLAIRNRAQPSTEHLELLGAEGRRAPRLRRRSLV